jgi:MFS family permease
VSAAEARLPVGRNTALLAATMAVASAVLQLVAAMASLTFVLVTGTRMLLGLGPAIYLTAAALSAVPAGRAMDRFGRIPVLVAGYCVGAVGCGIVALSTQTESAVLVVLGFALVGVTGGTALLTRTAAGDMYPPHRRARGISLVLFGSVFGAVLGPLVFGPLFAGRHPEADELTVPWLAGGAIALVAAGIALFVRPDPKRIGEVIAGRDGAPAPGPAAPLGEIVRRPGVIPAMVAALASFAVMVSVMNLTGYVVVDHHNHAQHSVFTIIGAHVLGMYALVLVVGTLIDRVGRAPSLAAGLVVMGVSCAGLLWVDTVWAIAVLLFGLGLGWNVSFVAATAEMADRTSPAERGKLLGFNDLIAALFGAALALLGGYALEASGVAALALGSTVIVLLPVLWLVRRQGPTAAVPEAR